MPSELEEVFPTHSNRLLNYDISITGKDKPTVYNYQKTNPVFNFAGAPINAAASRCYRAVLSSASAWNDITTRCKGAMG